MCGGGGGGGGGGEGRGGRILGPLFIYAGHPLSPSPPKIDRIRDRPGRP